MIIDCHEHLPPAKDGKTLEQSKAELLKELDKNKVDYAILIPDNTPQSEIGSLDDVLRLTKNDRRLYMMGTIDIQKRNYPSQIHKTCSTTSNKENCCCKNFPRTRHNLSHGQETLPRLRAVH